MHDFPIEVIIPTYDDFDRLSLALWGYTQQTFDDFLIHVVNDGGNEDIHGVIKKFPNLNIQYHFVPPITEKYRPSLTRNSALPSVKSPRVICTDTDIIPGPDLVESHLRFGGDPLIVVGRRCEIEESSIPDLRKKNDSGTLSYDDLHIFKDDYRAENDRPWVKFCGCSWDAEFDDMYSAIAWDCWSCNISYQTEGIKYLGGFCVGFDCRWGGEDTDLAMRLIKYGHGVVGLYDVRGYHMNHPLRARSDEEVEELNKTLVSIWNDPNLNLFRKRIL